MVFEFKDFSDVIEANLKKSGKTVTWLSEETGIPATTLYSILKRNNSPRTDTLEKVAKAFNLSIVELSDNTTGDTTDVTTPADTVAEDPVVEEPVVETPSATLGEQNAQVTAIDYLNTAAFSRSGLIGQLKYEGYSTAEATYGVDNCGADWNEQAALCADSYIKTMAFSRQGLIEQLVYEGFSSSQAKYGADSVGY